MQVYLGNGDGGLLVDKDALWCQVIRAKYDDKACSNLDLL